MKVFNSSVENHVEKASAQFEIAGQHGAYSYLHQFRAAAMVKESFFIRPTIFRKLRKHFDRNFNCDWKIERRFGRV